MYNNPLISSLLKTFIWFLEKPPSHHEMLFFIDLLEHNEVTQIAKTLHIERELKECQILENSKLMHSSKYYYMLDKIALKHDIDSNILLKCLLDIYQSLQTFSPYNKTPTFV